MADETNIPTIDELNNILGIAPAPAPEAEVKPKEPEVPEEKPTDVTPPPDKAPANKEASETPETPKQDNTKPVPETPAGPAPDDDFNLYTPEEQKFLTKEMSTKAREWVRARVKELREERSTKASIVKERDELKLKLAEPQGKPHYEHPQGYVLDEDYQQLVLSANKARANSEVIASQLALIEDGEDFQMPLVDDQGNVVLSSEKTRPTGAAKTKLLKAMAALDRQHEYFEQQAYAFQGAYEAKVKTQHGRVEALERQVIPDWDKIVAADKETATTYTANVEAVRKAGFNPDRDPWARAAIRAITIAQRQQAVINSMQAAINGATREKSIAKTVGPVGVGSEASKPNRGNGVTIADIQKAWGD